MAHAGAELSSSAAPPLPNPPPPPPPLDSNSDPLLDEAQSPPPPPPPDDLPHALWAPADALFLPVGAKTGWDSPAAPPPPLSSADSGVRLDGRAAQGGAARNQAHLGAGGGVGGVMLGLGAAMPQSAPLQFNLGGGGGSGRGAAAMGGTKRAGALPRSGGGAGRLKPAAAAFQVDSDEDA